MYILLITVLMLVCLALVCVVLIQSGKGSGLSGAFGLGEGQAVFGNRAGDILTKATTYFAVAFMLLCLAVAWQSRHSGDSLLARRRAHSGPVARRTTPPPTMEEFERKTAAAGTNAVRAAVANATNAAARSAPAVP